MVMNKILPDSSLYVKHWISINGLFSGCNYALKCIKNGMSQSIGIHANAYGTSEYYKELYESISPLYFLCPMYSKFDSLQQQTYYDKLVKKYSKYIFRGLQVPKTIIYPKRSKHYKPTDFLTIPKRWEYINQIRKNGFDKVSYKEWGHSYKNIDSIIHHLKTLLIHVNINGQ